MIEQAAIIDVLGRLWTLPRPNRHGHIIKFMVEQGASPKKGTQGFIDENRKFYNRKDARAHALEFKQTFYIYDPGDTSKRFVDPNPKANVELFSEDLW